MPAIPIAMVAISAYSAYKNAKNASNQTKMMQAGQTQAFGAGQQNQAAGKSLFNMGMPATQNAINYYSTILRGNRAAMQQATAGSAAQLTDVYRGAQRGLERQGVRGGEAATANAELNRDRANSIAQLTTGQQGGAAAALGQIGGQATGQAINATGDAGNAFNGVASQAAQQANYYTGNERSDMAGVGQGAGEILKWWQNRRSNPDVGQGSGLPSGGGA